MIGYGAANLINERLMLSSDVATMYVEQDTGLIGWKKRDKTAEARVRMSIRVRVRERVWTRVPGWGKRN